MAPALPEITVWGPVNNKVNKASSIVTTVLKQALGQVTGGERVKSTSE